METKKGFEELYNKLPIPVQENVIDMYETSASSQKSFKIRKSYLHPFVLKEILDMDGFSGLCLFEDGFVLMFNR